MAQGKMALDICYNPKQTPLLQEAMGLGCECIYGEEMFIEQARLQQQLWTQLCTGHEEGVPSR